MTRQADHTLRSDKEGSNENFFPVATAPEQTSENEIFQSILNAMDMGIALVSKNYSILYANDTLNKLLGRCREDQARKIYSITNLKIKLLKEVHRQLQNNEFWQGIIPNLGNGVKVTIAPIPFPIPPALSHLAEAFFMVQVIDSSELLEQQQKLVEAGNLVKKSDKAKSEFLSHMSHELRTPLNAILGFTQLMKSEPELSEEQDDNLNEILSASHHLLKLINDILDLSKIKPSGLNLFNENIILSDLISECISLTRPLAIKANIQLHQNTSRLSLANDRVRLKQVLINLLSNAVKYNIYGGEVLIQAFATDETIRIEIQDSGTGIPEQFLDTIFSPFAIPEGNQTPVQGRGIGLMITRRLVQQMNGKVSVISMPGSGSVFSLNFPADPSLSHKGANKKDSSLYGKARKILWIGQPSKSLQFATQLAALRPGLELHHTKDTTSAIEFLRDNDVEMIFITIDETLCEPVEAFLETEILLKKIPCIAVIDNSSYLKDQLNTAPAFNSQLPTPINTIGFMKIIDEYFYPRTDRPA